MIFRITLLLMILTSFTACGLTQGSRDRQAAEEKRLEQSFINNCLKYGFKTGSAQYNQCVTLERRTYKAEQLAAAADQSARVARARASRARNGWF